MLRTFLRPFLLLSLATLLTPLYAESDSHSLKALLKDHQYGVQLSEGSLSGPGAMLLEDAASQSRYFLVGEQHGIADVIEFTHALYRQIQPMGYDWYVTEVGPVSAVRLATLASQATIAKPFEKFYQRFPFAIPFAVYAEEVSLLRAVRRLSPVRPQSILGIDQEFVLSVAMHLQRLEALSDNQQFKAMLRNARKRERKEYAEIVSSGNPESGETILMAEDEQITIDSLLSMFTEAGSQQNGIASALADSRRIYRLFYQGQFNENNQQRAALMATYFERWREQIEAEYEAPRYLFKLGANHIARDLSVLNVEDIGKTVASLAEAQDSQSFHLLVLALSGTQNAWLPFTPESAKSTPIDNSAGLNKRYAALLDALPDSGGWQLYDLRPMRAMAGEINDLSEEARALIDNYDAVLTMNDVSAATLVPQGSLVETDQ